MGLRPHRAEPEGQNGVSCHGNRPHAVLRLPSAGLGDGARVQNTLPFIYCARPVFYEASRKLILKGADGVVFVADSQEERLDANFETMENLQEHLKEHSLNFDTIPYVLQLNKRDLPNAMAVPDLTKQLQRKGEPVLEGVAVTGQGVFETLKELAKLVLAELKRADRQIPSRLLPCPKLKLCI